MPNFFNVCVKRLTVPPYKSVELTKLSPAWHTLTIANVEAAWPDPTVTPVSYTHLTLPTR